jgi:hypothetical protein
MAESTNSLVPQYLDIDFTTMKRRLQSQLESSDIFKDYNFEGANITLLLELVSYLGAMTTYYINKVAKNQYIDTADIYETVHMLSRLRGYNPSGYRSASAVLTISVETTAGVRSGDEIQVPAWKQISCPDLTDSLGNPLKFATVNSTTLTIPAAVDFPYTFDIDVRQGIVTSYSFTGEDMIDYTIYLPFENYDYNDDIEDLTTPSIQVQINGETWTRVADFYDELSGLTNVNTVYMFRYDKYQKYVLEFSENRSYPADTDVISIKVLKTEGADGRAAARTITLPETYFIYNRTLMGYLNNRYVTVTNTLGTNGGASPETIEEIKEASTGVVHSQYRNVTKLDYVSHLESRSDVVAANVWGEQDITPSGSILEYNKVHISVIPDVWGTTTVETSAASAGIYIPLRYSIPWQDELSAYLEPRKILTVYEQYDLPEIVYFRFDIGLNVKRTYNYATVLSDVRNKLEYYFSSGMRAFNETISFLDIMDYIMDSSQESADGEQWSQVKGIQNLIIRNIDVMTHDVYEPNIEGNYPQYTVIASTYTGENQLRKILLGFNQFPALDIDYSTFTEES